MPEISDEKLRKHMDEFYAKRTAMAQQQPPFESAIRPSVPSPVRRAYTKPGEEPGGSVLTNIIDVLSRGEYASANTAIDFVKGKPFSLENAIKGFTGEDKYTYDEFVDEVFPEMGTWKRKGLGFLMSIFLDPTTYVPMGAVSKLTAKGIKATGRIGAVKKATTALDKSTLSQAFRPGAGLPKDYYEMKYYTKKKFGADQDVILDDVKYFGKHINKEDRKFLQYVAEHPKEVDYLSPSLKEKLYEIGDRMDALIDNAVETKQITPQIAAKWREKSLLPGNRETQIVKGTTPYVPRYYPGQGINISKGQIPPSMFEKAKKPGYLKNRKFETTEDAELLSNQFRDISTSQNAIEAEQKIKKYGLQEAYGDGAMKDFEDLKSASKAKAGYYAPLVDIVKSSTIRQLDQLGYTTRLKFVDDLLNKFGTKVKSNVQMVPEKYGVYLPRGSIRFYSTQVLSPSFTKNLREVAEKLKRMRIKTEKTTTTRTRTENNIPGGGAAESGPMAKLETVVKDALVYRGMSEPEAGVYVAKLKQNGAEGVDEMMKTITEKVDTVTTSLHSQMVDKDLLDIKDLSEAQKRWMVGVSKDVPTYMLPKDIAKDVNRMTQFFSGDPASRKFWALFDKAQNAWKMMATTVRLPFHMRNMYSNWWQAYASGMKNPGRFVQALDYQAGRFNKIKLGKKTYAYSDLKTMINELGIHGKGWMGADIPKKAFNEMESILKYGKLRGANPFEWGRKGGAFIEDNSRIAVFFDQLAKGNTPKGASREVRKYLFDYTELTPFERSTMKRVFPFYTWSRKNIPLQIETLLNKPRKFQIYGKARRSFEDPETPEERKLKPEYFEELAYVKSPWKTKQGKPLFMSVDLPPLEFNRMFELRHWASSMTPLKLAAEIGFNYKTFPEASRLKRYPLDVTRAPVWMQYLPKKTLSWMKDKHLIDTILNKQTGKRQLAVDKKLLHGIHGAFPFLSELNRIYAQPITLEDESPGLKYKSYLTGVGHKDLNLKLQRKRKAWEQIGGMRNIRSFINQRGTAPSKEEQQLLGFKGAN